MSIARQEGESFADFKERRISDNEQTRLALKPKLFWNSYYEGTYINPAREAKRLYKKAKRVQVTPHMKNTSKIHYTA